MLINKEKLQRALEIVKPGLVTGKEIIDQSKSFAFLDNRVVTYNDEISISYPIDGLELNGVIESEYLYKLLSKLKTEEIDIVAEENEIVITSGKAKAGFTFKSDIQLPIEEIGDVGKWKKLPEDYVKALQFCIPSCSKNMSSPKLACVHTSESFVQGCDNLRISYFALMKYMPVSPFLILYSSAQEVVKLNPSKIAAGEGWIHFKTDEGAILSCRTFDEKYPDTSSMLTVKGTKITLPKVTSKILDKASIFLNKANEIDFVNISIKNGKIYFDSKNESGWYKENAKIEYSGEPINFITAPNFLMQILSETSKCTISENKIRFEGDQWIYVSALQHINE
jgi:hypothetical protein